MLQYYLLENATRSVLCTRFVPNYDFYHDSCMDTWISYCDDLDKTGHGTYLDTQTSLLCYFIVKGSKQKKVMFCDVERSRSSVSLVIHQNRQDSLRVSDQLWKEAERGEIFFNGFCEGPLYFRPTYIYDASPKDRVPSWTNKIL